jgi:hypothetical protein
MLNTQRKKQKHEISFKCLSHPEFGDVKIARSQMLVGTADHSDIYLSDKSVNHYHALIVVENGSLLVMDLASVNGIYVNNKKVKTVNLADGDTLRFGSYVFRVCEEQTVAEFQDFNKDVAINQPTLSVVKTDIVDTDKLVWIDDEYCDIVFDESKVVAPKILEIEQKANFAFDTYLDGDEKVPYQFVDKTFEQKTLDLIFVTRGNIVSFDSLNLTGSNLTKNAKTVLKEWQWYFGAQALNLIEFKDGKIHINVPAQYQSAEHKESAIVFAGEPVILTSGFNQIFIRLGQLPGKPKVFFPWRDIEEMKKIATMFFAFLIPWFFLFLIDIPKVEPLKDDVVIIYTKAPANDSDSNSSTAMGEPMQNQDPAQSPEVSEVQKVAKAKDQPKKTEKQKDKKEAKATEAQKNQVKLVEDSPVKKPKVELASAFSKLVGNKTAEKTFESESSSSSSHDGANMLATGSAESVNTVGGSKVKGLKTNGSFGGAGGFQNAGLSGKSNFDSTLSATRTVVLGSIDPDLLRKILREYIPQFRYCYQKELARNPEVDGTIDLDFVINGQGKVSKSTIKSKNGNFSNSGMDCVDGVLKIIPFPKPKGGGIVEVRQPLNFSAEKTKI